MTLILTTGGATVGILSDLLMTTLVGGPDSEALVAARLGVEKLGVAGVPGAA